MSKSNASAKSRRAFISPPQNNPAISQQPQQQQQPSSSPTTGLTLQQVIAVIDKRLLNVESFVKESKEDSNRKIKFEDEAETETDVVPNNITEILSEYNSRFDLLAEEINNIKDIVMKLQSYTMGVNKTLMEERIHILSDLGNNNFENLPEATDEFVPETADEQVNFQISEVPSDGNEIVTPPVEPISTSLDNLGGPNYRRQRGRN